MRPPPLPPPSLVISEAFGPTFQGEGPSLGRRASFIRLMGCNLACSWCDTPYTWDARRYDLHAEGTRTPVAALLEQVHAAGTRLVVITGGEPLLHQRTPGWRALLEGLLAQGIQVEVETNGTIAPEPWAALQARFNVSPKLAHSGDSARDRLRPAPLAILALLAQEGTATFKFVASSPRDVVEIADVCAAYRLPKDSVWVMPLGTDGAALGEHLGALADAALAAGFNVTTRLHVLAWGNERKR